MARKATTLRTMDPVNMNPCAVAGVMSDAIRAGQGVITAVGMAHQFIANGVDGNALTADQMRRVLEDVWRSLATAREHGWL